MNEPKSVNIQPYTNVARGILGMQAANLHSVVESALVVHELKYADVLAPEVKKAVATFIEKACEQTPKLISDTMPAKELANVSKVALQKATTTSTEIAKKAAERSATAIATNTTKQVAATATKEVARGIGRAGVMGAAVEGVMATYTGVTKMNSGEWTGTQCAKHVGRSSAVGLGAGLAGTAAAAGAAVVLGPIGIPAALVITVVAGSGTRWALDSILPWKMA